jgi:hypothetical protein
LGKNFAGAVVVVHVDESLKISHFYHLAAVVAVLYQRVHLDRVFSVLGQESLDHFVVEQLFLAQPQNFEGLFLCNKPALDSEPLFSDLLAALVAEFLHIHFPLLLFQVASYLH